MKTPEELEKENKHWRRCVLNTLIAIEGYIKRMGDVEVPPVLLMIVHELNDNPDNPLAYIYQPYDKLPKTTETTNE